MIQHDQGKIIEAIPIDLITVINPRVRNRKSFRDIVDNIAELGLKKPITVSRREGPDGLRYDLICGQGRLEAYRSLGQTTIPAIVRVAETEDCLIQSLVENCARRKHDPVSLLHDIGSLKQRGYSDDQIAKKAGLTVAYVKCVIHLLEKGEQRLLRAVETGQIPVTVAMDIADSEDLDVQTALRTAYEKNLLRGRKLMNAKHLIEQRLKSGKGSFAKRKRDTTTTPDAVYRAYRDDADRKQILIQKADATKGNLMFATEALRSLLANENFVTLLRAEKLDNLPRNLANRIRNPESTAS
jgi:ParB family chromosome partitioning protein